MVSPGWAAQVPRDWVSLQGSHTWRGREVSFCCLLGVHHRGNVYPHVYHTNLRPFEVEKSIQGATGLLSNSEERTLLRDVLICDLEALWLWLMAFPSEPRAVPLRGVSASCPLSHLALSMVADVAVCREKLLVFILFFGLISRSPSSDLVFIELIEGGG